MIKITRRRGAVSLALSLILALALAVPAPQARAGASSNTGYSFSPVAFLGNPAPGGGFFTFDFEPSAVNSRGQVAFTADLALTTGGDDIGEGVFVGSPGQLSNPARVGQPAPGGGTFDLGELGRIGFNEAGDASFAFTLQPSVNGVPSGAYRFAHNSGTASAVMVPGQSTPDGGMFQGSFFNTGINDPGDMVFPGIVNSRAGIYLAPAQGPLTGVVKPGDPAPGGGVFDSAINGSINDAGQIAFGGHVASDPCVDIGTSFACGESVYLKSATTGAIQSIAHQGTASPCVARPYRTAFGPLLNNRGDLVFNGDLTTSTDVGPVYGVFLYSHGAPGKVACPGDSLPGGGQMVSAGASDATYGLNDQGQVSFAAVLNTDTNGIADTGVYVSANGSTTLVARTGTVIPGLGQIAAVGLKASPGPAAPPFATPGGEISNRGQVLFSATLTDGRVVLLLATPAA